MFKVLDAHGKSVIGSIFAAVLLLYDSSAHAASFKVLHSFQGGTDGCYPASAGLVLDKSGNLYGVTTGLACNSYGTIFEIPKKGTETTLYNFVGGSNGQGPDDTLSMDANGNLFGGTFGGGNNGCGVIFELTATGSEKTVHTFAGPPNDACVAEGTLLIDRKGNLYGTGGGGRHNEGAVFELPKGGKIELLYSFNRVSKGGNPIGGVIMDRAGNLYGTTVGGGPNNSVGTVFKLAPTGSETVLYGFKGSPHDGASPTDGLLMDQSGDLFGTTNEGGRPGCAAESGCGIVFKLEPNEREAVLHFFTGSRGDGANPFQGFIVDKSGDLYGTTEYGGVRGRCRGACGNGTVFKIAPDTTETILHTFREREGVNPRAGLAADAAGNLYGTTQFGGTFSYGTVFKITP